ncbi:Peptidoglycan/LPS O-acetylase OafA/YrhL, contains acyltransferase and SGNH-hydrolase domains [Pseudobutyrivibrio sp. 49]|uniref:acyltransferase family protein n=1 Tax=Pseudobutyrivibrio sp. 49 TaxID=1855344 RepID=UPI000884B19A|nr:acyltransferase [Pseudobutyrivibrio sp. 49]SDI72512.1 Peptidoglycan/LPS O-acetylase OafA/YrhL, contains acyltransferase and SGNH-hydrolase domains [Pseudobutyrivibrio sp. 49]
MEYISLYVFLAAVCFWMVTINKPALCGVEKIQKNANSLRGIFAIFIIFTHCTLAFQQLSVFLLPLRKVSTFGVGFFFVLSGYGLALSFEKKENYLNGFIVKKVILKIALAAVICRIISMILSVLILKKSVLTTVSKFFVGINWYIYAMCILYIIFYFVYKYIKNAQLRLICLWVAVISCTLLARQFDLSRSYYISEWAFPFGATLYEKKNDIDKTMKEHALAVSFFMIILLGLSFVIAIKAQEGTIVDLISHNIMLLPFYYFIMVMCKYMTFSNSVLNFLNKISFEIYLYQFIILEIGKTYLPSFNIFYFIFTTVFTIILAYAVYTVPKMIKNQTK